MPRIDARLVWQKAAELGGEELTGAVAELTGQRPGSAIDADRLTGTQMLSLQSILGVTAEELRYRPSAFIARTVPMAMRDARTLHVVLARYGPLTESEIISEFGWRQQDLNAAAEILQGLLSPTGRHLVRHQHVLSLEEDDNLLMLALANRLRPGPPHRLAPLEPKQACLVIAALRSLTPRGTPGIDLPTATLTALARRGIAQPQNQHTAHPHQSPEDAASQHAPFTLHPDVVFAFAPALPVGAQTGDSDHPADLPSARDEPAVAE